MVFDPQFLDLMQVTSSSGGPTPILFEGQKAGTSADAYGEQTYNAASSAYARIEQINQIVKSKEGQEVMSKTTLYVPPYTTAGTSATLVIGPYDRVTLPFGYKPLQPPIINVIQHNDDQGVMYFEVFL